MFNKEADFKTAVSHLLESTGKNVNLSGIPIAQNPEIAAAASKLIQPKDKTSSANFVQDDASGLLARVFPGADQISKQLSSRIEDAENAFKLFPDLELAAQIVITSILSPKDMLKTELNYRFENTPFSPTVSTKLLDIIRTEINQNYRLEEKLYEMLRNALFKGGSHPVLVLPESAVDQIINEAEVVTTESIRSTGLFSKDDFSVVKSIGILGDPRIDTPRTSALESITTGASRRIKEYNEAHYIDRASLPVDEEINVNAVATMMMENVGITDNLNIFKLPALTEAGRSQQIVSLVSGKHRLAAVENVNRTKLTASKLYSALYKSAPGGYVPYSSVPSSNNLKRRSIGRPLVLHLSPEAVAPVHVPGDPSKHIGAFIMIDADGNPVSSDSVVHEFAQGLTASRNGDMSGASTSSLITDKARANLMSDNYTPVVTRMAEVYSGLLEKDVLTRLAKGVYRNNEISVGINTEMSRIMLARAWKGRYTRLVYVPAEYMCYFAFNYHKNGVGRSYLDDLSNIISMRAMSLFSRLWAKVRSSIGVIKTNITFDQRDTDPVRTIENVKHFIAKSRQQYFPNDLRNVQDFTNWIQKAGIMITWDNHPRLPNTKIESESVNVDHVEPDQDLDEMLKNMTYMYFGLSPETVSSAEKEDFATTVQHRSILFARRSQMLSDIAVMHLRGLVQKIAYNDSIIQEKIIEVLNTHADAILSALDEDQKKDFEENKVRFTQTIVVDILNNLEVALPESESTATANLKEELEAYEALIDKVLESVISRDMLPVEIAGNSSEKIDMLKAIWKAQLMREFMANNNIAPEAFKIASVDETGAPMVNLNEVIKTHSSSLMLAVADLMKRMVPLKNAADKDLENIEAQTLGDPGDSDYSSSSDDSSGDSSSADDSGTGDDEFGLSMGDEGNPFDDEGGDNADDTADTAGDSTDTPADEEESSDEDNQA